MTNDMIAMASNWEKRLWAPKGEKKDDPQVWATSFPNLITLTKREKNLNPKAMITYAIPTIIGQLHTNYKHPWVSERFFQCWGAEVDFPKFFSRVGAKVVKFGFYPSKSNKRTFFATDFKIHGGHGPSVYPFDAH